jgi:uncharacterized protein
MIEYDSDKRNKTLIERGLDFENASIVFAGKVFEQDSPQEHGELRIITVGKLFEDIVVVVWTKRCENKRIISMRKARDNEKQLYNRFMGG